MRLLDGKKIASEIKFRLTTRVEKLGFKPKLAIVQVGDRTDANTYIARKVKFAEEIGVGTEVKQWPESVSEDDLIAAIAELNADQSVNGIIVQLPLPDHINKKRVIDAINVAKDADGLTDVNISRLFENETAVVPATPRGILTLLKENAIDPAGQHVVVLGRSRLVGKSAALLLLNQNATVTMCHSKTKNLPLITKAADIVVVAIGQPKFVTAEYLRDGQVVVDVGIGSDETERLVGDVDFDSVKDMDITISPVPGGVGPMTVASLFENLLDLVSTQI